MKKNMNVIDRVVRILIAAVVVILYFTNILSGTLALILLILSGIFILTGLIGFCPLYIPLGIKTIKKK